MWHYAGTSPETKRENGFVCEICSVRFFQTVTTQLKTIHLFVFPVDEAQRSCSAGPFEYTTGQNRTLDCYFTNFAVQNVRWYKDKKLLTNGSQGLRQVCYQSSVDTLLCSLLFPIVRFDHTGSYTCKQEPTPPNSLCPNGKITEIFVTCKCSIIAMKALEIH